MDGICIGIEKEQLHLFLKKKSQQNLCTGADEGKIQGRADYFFPFDASFIIEI